MNKLFRPKCLRRVLLCLALLFPIVYLCGGLFFALSGAHGNYLLADEENNTSISVSPSMQFGILLTSGGGTYNQNEAYTSNYIALPLEIGYSGSIVSTFNNEVNYFRIYYYDSDYQPIENLIAITPAPTNYIMTVPENASYFRFSLYALTNSYTTKVMFEWSESTPLLSSISYSDYLFSQPFAKNNFITSLGIDLVNGSTKGFAPMNNLFSFINSNMLHFESTDGLAMFGFGYVYYAVNVLIIYEILILAVKLIMLPLKAVDLFDKKEDI